MHITTHQTAEHSNVRLFQSTTARIVVLADAGALRAPDFRGTVVAHNGTGGPGVGTYSLFNSDAFEPYDGGVTLQGV